MARPSGAALQDAIGHLLLFIIRSSASGIDGDEPPVDELLRQRVHKMAT